VTAGKKSNSINKILLVDDDQNIRFVAQVSLEGLTKWHIILAESGDEALRKATAEKPDVIVLDMMMPGMDGPTTFSKLREQPDLALVPIIFMTAKVQTHEVQGYLELGAAGVITKPFDPMKLPEEICRIVDNE
jgi:CheY-like chemotaxis protein